MTQLDLIFLEVFSKLYSSMNNSMTEAAPVQSCSALQYTKTRALSCSILSTPTAREPSVWIFKTASLKFLLCRQVAQISQVLRIQELPYKVAPTQHSWMHHHHVWPYTHQVKSQIALKWCLLVIKGILKANSQIRCWNWSYQSRKFKSPRNLMLSQQVLPTVKKIDVLSKLKFCQDKQQIIFLPLEEDNSFRLVFQN